VHEIKEQTKESPEQGMQTFDQALFELYEAYHVRYEDAVRFADSQNEVRLAIKLRSKRFQQDPPKTPDIPDLGLAGH